MPGLASATARSGSRRRPAITTWLPSRCNDSARPRPIPVPPPVTSTVLSVICIAAPLLRFQYRITTIVIRTATTQAGLAGGLQWPCASESLSGDNRAPVVQSARVDARAAPRRGRPGRVDEPQGQPVDERIQRAHNGGEQLESLLLLRIPLQPADLTHLRRQGSDQDQPGVGVERRRQDLPDRPGNPARARYPFPDVAGGVQHGLVRDEPVEHLVPVGHELVVGLRLATVADPVEPIPGLALVEDLLLFRTGQAADKRVGRVDDLVDERRVRPVEQLRIERVVPRTVTDGALDRLVKVADLAAPPVRVVGVDGFHHGRCGSLGPSQRVAEDHRVIEHALGELLDAVLDTRDALKPEELSAVIAVELPYQRLGP